MPLTRLIALTLALCLLAASCGRADASSTRNEIPRAVVTISETVSTEPQFLTPATTSTAPPTTTTTTTVAPTTTTTEAPPLGEHDSLVATANDDVQYLTIFDGPAGNVQALPFPVPNPHQFGGPLTMLVTEGAIGDEWVKVQLPIRPNGQEAWIKTRDYSLSVITIRAEVNLSSRSVTVWDGDEVIAETSTGIGTAATPTPVGEFYVASVRENPPEEAFLGSHALVLSGFSEALETFSGGLPVIAIHGTLNPDDDLGHEVSNGCLRVPNDVIGFLAQHVPVGTPVSISN